MAQEDLVNEEIPENQVSDGQLASVLRQRKHQAQPEKRQAKSTKVVHAAGTATKTSGRAIQVGGAATEYGGKAAKYAGKGVQAAGRGVEKGGQAITRAGAGLSESGYGAIIGVPLAILGAGITGLGVGTQAAGKGIEYGGQTAEKGGQAARQTGKEVSRAGSNLQTYANRFDGLRSRKSKKRQDKDKGRSLLGGAAGATADNMGLSDQAQARISKTVHLLATPVRWSTDWALRASWLNIIDSFGLTLIYINIHVFFRFVIGTDFFCKLGHEWASSPAKGGGEAMAVTKVTTVSASGAQHTSSSKNVMGRLEGGAGIVEAFLLATADLIILLAILSLFGQVAFVVGMITYPVQFVGKALF